MYHYKNTYIDNFFDFGDLVIGFNLYNGGASPKIAAHKELPLRWE